MLDNIFLIAGGWILGMVIAWAFIHGGTK